MVKRYIDKPELEIRFGGWVQYRHEKTGEEWLGIWGERKAGNFRTLLRERGAVFRVEKQDVADLKWETSHYRRRDRAIRRAIGKSREAPLNAAAFAPKADDVFARIATRYDLLCDIFSLFIHRRWKARMARLIAEQSAETILDAASGTGHIAQRVLRFLRRQKAGSTVKKLLVTDLCPQMLAVAKAKPGMDDPVIEYALRDVHDMREIWDNSVDVFSIAFAMKICDRKRVVAEAMRVLKPGGQFFCLEASRIPSRGVQSLYLRYMDWCLPVMGWIATGGDRSAYNYLLRGIHGFPAAPDFAQELRETGFGEVSYQNLTFGIVALHRAKKP